MAVLGHCVATNRYRGGWYNWKLSTGGETRFIQNHQTITWDQMGLDIIVLLCLSVLRVCCVFLSLFSLVVLLTKKVRLFSSRSFDLLPRERSHTHRSRFSLLGSS